MKEEEISKLKINRHRKYEENEIIQNSRLLTQLVSNSEIYPFFLQL